MCRRPSAGPPQQLNRRWSFGSQARRLAEKSTRLPICRFASQNRRLRSRPPLRLSQVGGNLSFAPDTDRMGLDADAAPQFVTIGALISHTVESSSLSCGIRPRTDISKLGPIRWFHPTHVRARLYVVSWTTVAIGWHARHPTTLGCWCCVRPGNSPGNGTEIRSGH